MRIGVLRAGGIGFLLGAVLWSPAHAQDRSNNMKTVTLWYEAFNKRDPRLAETVLSESWVDIPAAPGQPSGLEGLKHILVQLTTAFPDLNVRIEEMLQDGDKVVVRSEITGTHRGPFMGIPPKNRKLAIQAIDIHEVRNGKIVRTWHTEDWLTGLHQLGAFEK
jgi:steroid delta-isomerase-like uncharacterized protein